MTRQENQRRVNMLLAGEQLSITEMIPFLDQAIDDINSQLSSTYPAFSELDINFTEYRYFPERYMRSVVCLGAAVYFYKMDEEGGNAPPGYNYQYADALFHMLRDYASQVPDEYQQDNTGYIGIDFTGEVKEQKRTDLNISQRDFLL